MFELVCLMMVVVIFLDGNYLVSAKDVCGQPFQCGKNGLNFGYPFWSLNDSQNYCGYQGFGINCSNGMSILTVASHSYSVKSISYTDQSLTAVDLDFRAQPCVVSDTKDLTEYLTNEKKARIYFSTVQETEQVLLFYGNCSSSLYPKSKLDISCLDHAGTNRSYFLTQERGADLYKNCEEIIKIPVLSKVTNISNLSTYASVMQEGFQLVWRKPYYGLCYYCELRGGYCSSLDDSFVCDCPSGSCDAKTDEDYCGQPFQCGKNGIKISYPFRSIKEDPGRSGYCGYNGLGVNCSNGKPILTIGSQAYWVKSINYTDQTLTAMDLDFMKEPCATAQRRARSVGSETAVTEDDGLSWSYSVQVLYFYRNCSSYPKSKLDVSCIDSTGTNLSYFLTQNPEYNSDNNCQEVIGIPIVGQATNISNLSTYASVMQGGFPLRWYNRDWQCQECEDSGGRCLFDQAANSYDACMCSSNSITYDDGYCSYGGRVEEMNKTVTIGRVNQTAPPVKQMNTTVMIGKVKNMVMIGTVKKLVMIGVLTGFGSLLLIIIFVYRRKLYSCIIRRGSNKKSNKSVEVFLENYGRLSLHRYKYSDLKKVTSCFKDKLGQGGYGGVFKGKLKDGCLIAVKLLNDSKANGEDFINEVATIGRTNHINIVSLLGFCSEGSKRALVYEYMPNGSLEKFIYNGESTSATHALGHENLFKIALGIANGLEYLHRGCNTRILHFDIKPHNILLDKDFCPKISDFGLAKLCPTRESVVSMLNARGTLGYIAPEVYCRNFGGVSPKSDVYSYGMMVLEMVGGRKNIDATVDNTSEIYFPQWIYNHLGNAENDGLGGLREEFEEESIKKMIIVGLWCIQTHPANRPSMNMVVEMLQKSVDDLQMPPNPFLDPTTSSQETA